MSDVAIRSIASLGIFVLALVLIWLVERIAWRGIEGTYERLYMRSERLLDGSTSPWVGSSPSATGSR